jgi:protein involved in polysaccharide export with SLBB domain
MVRILSIFVIAVLSWGWGVDAAEIPSRPLDSIENVTDTLRIINAGEKIKVNVYHEDDLSGIYDVSLDGNIVLPLIGEVPVLNLTVVELKGVITSRLKKYLVNPQVTIVLGGGVVKPVVVDGFFGKAGSFPYEQGMTLIKVIALAGGLNSSADPARIEIVRTLKDGQTKAIPVDLTKIIMGKLSDPEIYPGDIIKSAQSYEPIRVDGYVNKPGFINYQEGMTLYKTIALAGDMTAFADPRKVQVIRPVEQGEPKIFYVNLLKIMSGEEKDFGIFPGDIIRLTESYKPIMVMGLVNKPGAINYFQGATILKVIALAGDVKEMANIRSIRIVRTAEGGQRKAFLVNLAQIYNGKAQDTEIQPGDIIKVPESFF